MILGHGGIEIVVGLTQPDLDKLASGEIIVFDGARVGVPGKRITLIGGGESGVAIAKRLIAAGIVTAKTKIINGGDSEASSDV